MNNSLNRLIELSHAIAEQGPLWIQGAGGNLSYKDEANGNLWIKASGYRLRELSPAKGIVCLAYRKLLELLKQLTQEEDYALALSNSAVDKSLGLKPSMEAGFHAVLPQKWVLHFHSCEALLMSYEKEKDPLRFESWLKKSPLRFECLGQLLPGLQITQQISERLKTSPDKDVYILKTHGVILHSHDPSILEKWKTLCESFCNDFGYSQMNIWRGKDISTLAQELSAGFYLKIYFPDTAVFYQQLLKTLKVDSNGFCSEIPTDFLQKNRDFFEICLATHWLYTLCPHLDELPSDMLAKMAHLPTEQIRLAQQQKKDKA